MDIEIRTQSQVKVIKLRGRLTLGESVDKLRDSLDEMVDVGESRFLLDLGEVAMIDSSGIGLIVKYLTGAKQRGRGPQAAQPVQIRSSDSQNDRPAQFVRGFH